MNNLLEYIDNVKEKISDQEYINIMNEIKDIHDTKQKVSKNIFHTDIDFVNLPNKFFFKFTKDELLYIFANSDNLNFSVDYIVDESKEDSHKIEKSIKAINIVNIIIKIIKNISDLNIANRYFEIDKYKIYFINISNDIYTLEFNHDKSYDYSYISNFTYFVE